MTSSITGTSRITVTAAAASTFTVSTPATATAGTAFNASVTAKDAFGNTVTGYTGTIHLTSSDTQAVLPADYSFIAADNGTHTFTTVTLKTAGSQSVTATDTLTSSITGTSGTVAVSAAAASHFTVSTPATATAGAAFNATVTALDPFNNTATGYRGTVHFTSSDGAASLPANYVFTAGDNGVHTFASGVTLNTVGNQTVTATDTATGSITGTSGTVAVSAAAANHFSVSTPPTATARAWPSAATVTARSSSTIRPPVSGPFISPAMVRLFSWQTTRSSRPTTASTPSPRP